MESRSIRFKISVENKLRIIDRLVGNQIIPLSSRDK